MPTNPSVIELSALDGSKGFRINGEAAGDLSGYSVASAGDINGDGFADLIIGARDADPNGDRSGASYVVFGKESGFAANLELSALDGSNGFQINGESAADESGRPVASAGDVNGDGFADLIIGAQYAYGAVSNSGASYVVFGKESGFASNLELSTLDGSTGFQINGEAAHDFSGRSVASAGDVNGDGFDDLIIGALGADTNGYRSGASFVVFGKASGFASNLALSALDGTNGFQINGEADGDRSGVSVASAGDVNDDSFADLVVGAFNADPNGASSGASYVIYGRATGALNRTGTDQADTLGGGDWDDTLSGLGGDDRLQSGAGDDVVNGGADDDYIAGGAGADSLNGGAGSDTAGYSGSTNGVTVNLLTGIGSGGDAAGDTLTSIENVTGSAGNDSLTGNGKANRLFGEDGNDTLSGRFGDDTVRGGNGNDLLDGGAGNDFVFSGFDNDTINASAGNDTIDGSLGTDLLDVAANFSGAAVVDLAAGTASFFGGHTALISNVEGVLGTDAADSLIGDSGANWLAGGNGDDTLIGAGDNDTLNGGGGADSLNGGAGSDNLMGGSGNDTLIGAGGNDTLIGGAGGDSLNGGTGRDTADYSASAGAVTVNLLTGTGSGGHAQGDTLTSIENVIGSGGGDSLRGNAGANSLIGNGGNDYLSGAWGNDTLFGGFGGDTLIGGAGADSLGGGAGNDVADYSASGTAVSVNLATGTGSGGDAAGDTLSGIENVFGSAGDDSLTGDSGANWLGGGDGQDTLTGGSGNDTLNGGNGNDTLTGGNDDDRLNGGSGNDNLEGRYGDDDLLGQSGNDRLIGWGGNDGLLGGSGDDTLNGGGGNDTLAGGGGFDVMRGGSGNDVFDFNRLSETSTGALRDRIPDFTQGDDVIDLAGIDADTTQAGNDAFHFIGSTPFGGHAGELRQFSQGSNTIIEGDVNGDGNADFQIALTTASLTLTDGDFVL